MSEETRLLRGREEILDEEEMQATQNVETASELLAVGTVKIQRALSTFSCRKNSALSPNQDPERSLLLPLF